LAVSTDGLGSIVGTTTVDNRSYMDKSGTNVAPAHTTGYGSGATFDLVGQHMPKTKFVMKRYDKTLNEAGLAADITRFDTHVNDPSIPYIGLQLVNGDGLTIGAGTQIPFADGVNYGGLVKGSYAKNITTVTGDNSRQIRLLGPDGQPISSTQIPTAESYLNGPDENGITPAFATPQSINKGKRLLQDIAESHLPGASTVGAQALSASTSITGWVYHEGCPERQMSIPTEMASSLGDGSIDGRVYKSTIYVRSYTTSSTASSIATSIKVPFPPTQPPKDIMPAPSNWFNTGYPIDFNYTSSRVNSSIKYNYMGYNPTYSAVWRAQAYGTEVIFTGQDGFFYICIAVVNTATALENLLYTVWWMPYYTTSAAA